MKPRWKARPVYWMALAFAVFMVPLMGPLGVALAQNANTTIGYTANANTTTQVIGPGGSIPANPYGISTFAYATTGVMSAGAQFSLVQGSVGNETPACNTNRVALTGALPVAFSGSPTTGTQNAPPSINLIQGSPAIVVAGSSVMCVVFTGTTGTSLTGWSTLNR